MLAELGSPENVGLALLVAATASRSAMAVGMKLLPNARSDGLSAGAGRPTAISVGAAIVIAWLLAVMVLGISGAVVCFAVIIAVVAFMVVLANRMFGGQTGDVLGALQLLTELGCLMAAIGFV